MSTWMSSSNTKRWTQHCKWTCCHLLGWMVARCCHCIIRITHRAWKAWPWCYLHCGEGGHRANKRTWRGKGTGFGGDLQSHSSGDTVPPLEAREGGTVVRLVFTHLPLLTLLVLSPAELVQEQDSIPSNYSAVTWSSYGEHQQHWKALCHEDQKYPQDLDLSFPDPKVKDIFALLYDEGEDKPSFHTLPTSLNSTDRQKLILISFSLDIISEIHWTWLSLLIHYYGLVRILKWRLAKLQNTESLQIVIILSSK